jgi:hypothetical protein
VQLDASVQSILKGEKEGKVVPVDTEIHVFLTSILVGRSGELLLYPRGKSLWYLLDRRLGGPERQS